MPTMEMDGTLSFVGIGKKTVDVQQIKDRFKSLGVTADWKRFDALITARNELEHYFSTHSSSILRELIADAFVVLHAFLKTELHLRPVEVLGSDTWERLLHEAKVFDETLVKTRSDLAKLAWFSGARECLLPHFRCQECGSALLTTDPDSYTEEEGAPLICTLCGDVRTIADMFEHAMDHAFGADHYIAATRGGEPPTSECHECGKLAFLTEAGECLACGATLSYTECAVCGEGLGPDDQHGRGLCDYHRWISEQRDED